MEDIRFYDYDFNLLHIEHDIISCNWTLYDNEIGRFEMHFPLTSPLVDVMMQHPYVVAVQGNKQAVITGKQFDREGALFGRSCNWLLTRFYIREQFDTDSLLADRLIASKDAKEVCHYICRLAFGELVKTESEEETYGEVSVENKDLTSVYQLIQTCLEAKGLGHRLLFDVKNRRWVFCVTKGKMQNILLSEDNRNAHETIYTEDRQDYFTGAWFKHEMTDMGDWDAEENSPYLRNKQSGNYAKGYRVTKGGTHFGITFVKGDYIVCHEKSGVWQKADSLSAFPVLISSSLQGLCAWEGRVDGDTEEEALQNLGHIKPEKTIETKLRQLAFGKDYEPGDSIKVEIQKGACRQSAVMKIAGVRLWYEQNDIGEEPIMKEAEA